jgi:hypothetical protein
LGFRWAFLAGRFAWQIFANQLGTLPEPVTPQVPLLLLAPAAILAANVIAVLPAIVASRLRAATVLRAE